MTTKKRVLILIPTNGEKSYCIGKFLRNLKSIDLSQADVLFSDDTVVDDGHKKIIESQGFEVIKVTETVDAIRAGKKLNIVQCLANTRKLLRSEFIKRKKYDYALWFDSDIIMPYDAVTRLLKTIDENKLDLVSGVYWQKRSKQSGQNMTHYFYPVIFPYLENECYDLKIDDFGREMELQELFPGRLIGGPKDDIRFTALGTGIFICSRKLMEDEGWQFRFNPEKPNTTEDMWFSIDLRKLGYEIYLDSRVCCRHHMRAWQNKTKDKSNQT